LERTVAVSGLDAAAEVAIADAATAAKAETARILLFEFISASSCFLALLGI
jgi:hypothetical protein